MALSATVRVTGTGRLADFRERVRWLMVRDPDAEDYTEHHSEGVLEYRFSPRKGIPFPAFAAASSEYPELRVEAEWKDGTASGAAVIENGKLVEQSAAPEGAAVDVEVAEDARLVLALVCASGDGEVAGYAACAERHTYFRLREGELTLLAPEEADPALEDLAHAFAGEWLWYDEAADEAAALERSRYAGYGYPVRGANLRSEKLALLRRGGGRRHAAIDVGALAAREALLSGWLSR